MVRSWLAGRALSRAERPDPWGATVMAGAAREVPQRGSKKAQSGRIRTGRGSLPPGPGASRTPKAGISREGGSGNLAHRSFIRSEPTMASVGVSSLPLADLWIGGWRSCSVRECWDVAWLGDRTRRGWQTAGPDRAAIRAVTGVGLGGGRAGGSGAGDGRGLVRRPSRYGPSVVAVRSGCWASPHRFGCRR